MIQTIQKNRRWFYLSVTTAFVQLFAASTVISAAPRIVVEQPVYDFGIITNGLEILHDFVIRNVGDADLKINRVISGCNACLHAGMSLANIPPGGKAVLHSQLDLRLMSGSVSRAIMVECNDSQNAFLGLELTGVVVPAYQVTPLGISLDLSQGQPTGTAEILSLFELHAPLSQINCDNTNIEVKISQKSFTEFVLTAQAKHISEHGDMSVKLMVCSVDSNDLPCFVSVWIHNPPEVEVVPLTLLFQSRTEQQTRILWLKQHGAAPLTLLDVVASSDKYHCEIDPDPVSNNYRIYVNAWQQDPVADQTNVLTLKLKDSRNHEKFITVPILIEQP
jgi:Protein of unknown function (DUF1573)